MGRERLAMPLGECSAQVLLWMRSALLDRDRPPPHPWLLDRTSLASDPLRIARQEAWCEAGGSWGIPGGLEGQLGHHR